MDDQTIRLAAPGGLALTLSNRGAAWLACELDLGGGRSRALILPRASADDASADRAFLGATVGRYANRIAGGRIALGGRQWQLECGAGNPRRAKAPGDRH